VLRGLPMSHSNSLTHLPLNEQKKVLPESKLQYSLNTFPLQPGLTDANGTWVNTKETRYDGNDSFNEEGLKKRFRN